MAVPRGNYTQVRLDGFGYGDASLETDISQVKVEMSIEADVNRALNTGARFSFDLLVFEKQKDYLCYVEAVHLMYQHPYHVKKCSFVNDQQVFRYNTRTYDYDDNRWLTFESRTNSLFVIIDNTAFRQA